MATSSFVSVPDLSLVPNCALVFTDVGREGEEASDSAPLHGLRTRLPEHPQSPGPHEGAQSRYVFVEVRQAYQKQRIAHL